MAGGLGGGGGEGGVGGVGLFRKSCWDKFRLTRCQSRSSLRTSIGGELAQHSAGTEEGK